MTAFALACEIASPEIVAILSTDKAKGNPGSPFSPIAQSSIHTPNSFILSDSAYPPELLLSRVHIKPKHDEYMDSISVLSDSFAGSSAYSPQSAGDSYDTHDDILNYCRKSVNSLTPYKTDLSPSYKKEPNLVHIHEGKDRLSDKEMDRKMDGNKFK